LKVGTSGPTLLEDFRLREKITTSITSGFPGVDKTLTKAPVTALGLHRARDRAELVMNSAVAPAV
jgi:hypothetical protein